MRKQNPWQANRLGPYTLLRRLRHVSTSEEVGRVYTARHRPSGRPALLVAPTEPEQLAPASEWRLRVRSGTAPAPYVALEVEQAPGGAQPTGELAQGMGTLWLTLRGVEGHPEALAHLSASGRPARRALAAQGPLWAAAALAMLYQFAVPRRDGGSRA